MNNNTIEWGDLPLTIKISAFKPQEGIAEYHAIITYNDRNDAACIQFSNIAEAIKRLRDGELKDTILVSKRYFHSDVANQGKYLGEQDENGAVSIVQQPPLNGTKISVWLYFVGGGKLETDRWGMKVFEHSAYKHLYAMQLHNPLKNESEETQFILENYTKVLSQYGCTLKDNCIRTWIYIQGIDIHYMDMVKTRLAFFEREGLTQHTHYIASTGIEGRYTNAQSLVLMDAYSIEGIVQEQVKYLHALSHLSSTYKYGVTFERGTAVDYGDRRHIFISGTASIDPEGEIVSPDDIIKQADRTFENIGALLNEAQAHFEDIAQMIVYLRDTADYQLVFDYVEKRYPNIPHIIVWAPVCRPGWLIEVECIALKEIEDHRFNRF